MIKIDLSNTYNQCSWLYLRLLLIHINVIVQVVNYIMGCVTSLSFVVLINVFSFDFFPCGYCLTKCEEFDHDFGEPCQILELVNCWGVWKEHRRFLIINCFISSHFGCSMVGGIVPPFNERGPLFPLVVLFRGEATKINFQTFFDNFSLTMCLWVIPWSHL